MTNAFRRVLRAPDLFRVELSWGVAKAALWGWVVTINAVAFSRGGAWAVGVILAAHIIPGALATPVASVLAERWGPLRGLAGLGWVRATAMAATAAAIHLDAPVGVLAAIAAVEGLGSEPHDSVHMRVLPWLARSAEELTAANGLTEILRMAGILVGPVTATVLLTLTTPDVTILVGAGAGLLGALLLVGLGETVPAVEASEVRPVLHSLADGRRGLFGDRDMLILVAWCSWTAVCTATLQVFSTGLSMDYLGLGNSGPSLLTALFGLGGLAGGVVSLLLAGRRDLAVPLTAGAWLVGGVTIAMGVWPNRPVIFGAMALSGAGLVVLVVAVITLMQRGVPLRLQSAVFGINALMTNAVFGLGGLLGSALVAAGGLRRAVAVTGISMIVLTAISFRALRALASRSNAHAREVGVARSCPIFGVLPIGPLERVAAALERVDLQVGQSAVRQGDPGEHFFIVATGRLAVLVDGVEVGELRDGDAFGEIALLEDVPRTATVLAREASEVYRLDRSDFLAALSASPESRSMAGALSEERIGRNARLRDGPR